MKRFISIFALVLCVTLSYSQSNDHMWTTVNYQAVSGEHNGEQMMKLYTVDTLSMYEFTNLTSDINPGNEVIIVLEVHNNEADNIIYTIYSTDEGVIIEDNNIYVTKEYYYFRDMYWDFCHGDYLDIRIITSAKQPERFNISLEKFAKHGSRARSNEGDPSKIKDRNNN